MKILESTIRRVCIALTFAACAPEQAIDVAGQSRAIINGDVEVEEGSAIVRVMGTVTCSATLVRNNWVVTAAHCIPDADEDVPSNITLSMGSQSFTAKRAIRHPVTDAALIELTAPFSMSGSTTNWNMPIFEGDVRDFIASPLFCMGYGNFSLDGTGSGTLRSATLDVVTAELDWYKMLPNAEGQIITFGDSGGPCFAFTPFLERVLMGDHHVLVWDWLNDNISSETDAAAPRYREWAIGNMLGDQYGAALASGDFDGDGKADLAVGAPGRLGTGRVVIFRGGTAGLTHWLTLDESSMGANIDGDRFGAALATGDFNGDGRADLAVGAPNESLGGQRSGYVLVFRGTSTGLTPLVAFGQSPLGVDEGGDAFGSALAAGDFDGDGRADLAVGAPQESVSGAKRGHVFTFHSVGATLVPWLGLAGDDDGARFGDALASGDFDGDGKDDLAVGAPGHTNPLHLPFETNRTGAVHVFRGSPSGLSSWTFFWQATDPASQEPGDLFGNALAVGDFNNDGKDDLAAGVVGEGVGDAMGAGRLQLFKGSSTGLSTWVSRDQSGLGINELGDALATSLASGDFDGDGRDDIAAGAPGESPGSNPEAGNVYVYHGTPTDPAAWFGFAQNGLQESGDWFGGAMASGDFDGDGKADLAIGAPGEAPGIAPKEGYVFTMHGTPNGLSAWTGLQYPSLLPCCSRTLP